MDLAIKILKSIKESLEDCKDRPIDAFMNGRNTGLDEAIMKIDDKINDLKGLY